MILCEGMDENGGLKKEKDENGGLKKEKDEKGNSTDQTRDSIGWQAQLREAHMRFADCQLLTPAKGQVTGVKLFACIGLDISPSPISLSFSLLFLPNP